jgi:anti-anti-sigma regulatory factor
MMKVMHIRGDGGDSLIVKGSLSIEYSREIAYLITEVIHTQAGLKVDLSGVEEVDAYGSRLVNVLHQLMQSKSLEIVAVSPIVDKAISTLPSSSHRHRPGAKSKVDHATKTPVDRQNCML